MIFLRKLISPELITMIDYIIKITKA